MDKIYVTKAGFEKLSNDADHLRTVKRKEIAQNLATARAFGDLSENAEYEAAKHAFALNELRIRELEDQLAHTEILDPSIKIASDKVYLGATVTVLDIDYNEEETYRIVSTVEADPSKGAISTETPVAKTMLGHAVGDIVEIVVPKGTLNYKILKITRD